MPKQSKRGDVQCGQLRRTKTWPSIDGYERFNVCSSNRGLHGRELSPMLLGDYTYECSQMEIDDGEPNSIKVIRFENMWQHCKIWGLDELDIQYFTSRKLQFDPKNDEHLDHIKPSALFYQRRRKGWASDKGKRRVAHMKHYGGKTARPLFSFWKGKFYRYIESRMEIYCPVYEQLARNTKAYKDLEKKVSSGKNVLIVGYDGYDLGNKTLQQCIDDPSRPFGHELVLVAMLKQQRVWND
jgi:hypothetical protein